MSAKVYTFGRVDRWFGGTLRPAYRVMVLVLLMLAAAEIVLSSRQESQVSDEAVHLYAGYEYWKHGDFGRNPEHPPLAKLVAAAGILPLGTAEPSDAKANFKARDFDSGAKFLYGGDADRLLARGRGVLLLFPLGLALAMFAAGREMFGPEAGLLAMALFCLEPMVLGNGGLILTDMTLSCVMFASAYAFYRYLKRPGVGRLLMCGAAVGLTLAAKQSGVFVLLILGAVAGVDVLLERRAAAAKDCPQRINPHFNDETHGTAEAEPLSETSLSVASARAMSVDRRATSIAVAFAVITVVGIAMLWAFYSFRYAARPDGLAMMPTLAAYGAAVPNRLEAAAIGFCARHHLLPEAYLYGWADILQIPGTRVSFVLGKLVTGSWWPGFPLMMLMKTTIGLMALLVLVPVSGVWRRRREFLFLAIPAAVYLLIAMASGMGAEARYVLPVYPFAMVLAGAAGWEMARRSRGWAIAVGALMVLVAGSSLHAFPDYLAYANEAFGGPSQSYRWMAGTNGDGGQSLKWVKSYLDRNHISECWIDYSNPYVDPKYYGIPCKPLVSEWVELGAPFLSVVPPTIRGTVLISTTERAARVWEPDALNPYAAFDQVRPDAEPGNVVLAYRGIFDVHLMAAYSHSLVAKKLAEEGKMGEAVEEAEEAARLAPDSASMQAGLGLTLMGAGRTEEGRQANSTALRLAKAVRPEAQGQLIRLLQMPGMTSARQ